MNKHVLRPCKRRDKRGTSRLLSAASFAISLDRAMRAIRTQAVGRAFCSTANLGAGFDVFGLALNRYSDTVSARITSGKKIRIIVRGREGQNIPAGVERNSAGPPALELGEKAVAGTAHADNVAASLLGGFAIVYDDPIRTISLKPPAGLAVVVATPRLPFQSEKTRKARKIIPDRISVQNAVLNVGRASAMAVAFAQGDIRVIGTGMNDK